MIGIAVVLVALATGSVQAQAIPPADGPPGRSGNDTPLRSGLGAPLPGQAPLIPAAPGPAPVYTGAGDLALQDAVPTLELGVTLRLLNETWGALSLGADQVARLRLLLARLSGAALSPLQAAALDRELRAALLPAQLARLAERRAALDRTVAQFMARARFAQIEGQNVMARFAYAQLLGSLTVQTAVSQPARNVYAPRQPGAALLRRVQVRVGAAP